MGRIFVFLALLVLMSTALSAEISDPTADDRYQQLTRFSDMAQERQLVYDQSANMLAVQAQGWLMGLYDMMAVNGSLKSPVGICAANAVPSTTMASIYIKYMDAHPTSHQQAPIVVATLSAMEAYPCPKERK